MNNLFITEPEQIIKSTKKIQQITNEDDEDILKLILEKDKEKPKKEKRKTKKEMSEEQRTVLVERLKGMRETLAQKRAEKKKESTKAKPEEKQSTTKQSTQEVKEEVKELVKEPKQTKVSRANDKIDRLDAINNTLNKLLSYKEEKHKAAKKDTPEPILQIPTTEQPKLKEPEPTPTPEPPKPVQILPDIEEPPELPSFKSLNFNKFRR